MGEAFDRAGHFLSSETGQSKKEVFDKLMQKHGDEAAEIRIRSLGASSPMPKYRCHKEVWALKIQAIQRDSEKAQAEGRETDGSAMLTPEEAGYAPFRVDADYLRKHDPKVGGYYVVYTDGYKSFSPASAFEEGYTRI